MMAYCKTCKEWKDAETYFGKYKSGNPKSMCRLCDSARQQEYKKRALADPARAAKFKRTQSEYSAEWRARPGNLEKQRQYRRDWYERNKHGEAIKRSRANYMERHPDRLKAIQKRYRDKIKNDPKKHQAFLEQRRIEYHLRLEKQGKPAGVRLRKMKLHQTHVYVPVEPLRQWVNEQVRAGRYGGYLTIAKQVGMDEAAVRRIGHGTYPTVDIGTADRILHMLNGPPLRSMYPDA